MKAKKSIKILTPIITLLITTILIIIGINVGDCRNNPIYSISSYIILFVALFLSFAIFLIEVGSIFFDKEASTNTIFMAICIIVFLITSRDFLIFIKDIAKDDYIFRHKLEWFFGFIHLLSYILFLIFVLRFFVRDYNFKINKVVAFCSAIVCVFLLFTYGIFSLINSFTVDYLYLFCLIPLSYYWVIYIIINLYHIEEKFNIALFSTITFVCFTLAELVTLIGKISGDELYILGIDSFLSLFALLNILFIYIDFSYRITKEAYKKDVFEKKIKELETAILSNQINPHYIFNSLNSVKEMYCLDKEMGNLGIDLLSKNLRRIINSKSESLIPLEKELESVLNYINFENLKLNKEYNVIFNIEYTDINVPPLSLLTLVENAIKHAKIDLKDDGFIEISTKIINNYFIISIIDNGIGFDVKKINYSSCGINNTRERLKLLLNGTLEINSVIGKGTEINIFIPYGENDECDCN